MWRVSEYFDLVVVGAGPAGSAAAIAGQRAGMGTLLLDALPAHRDKTCGDGLTPRAVDTLELLGLPVPAYRNRGLKLHGYGGDVEAPWPRGEGSASPRATFDAMLVGEAARAFDAGGAELAFGLLASPALAAQCGGTVSFPAGATGTASNGAVRRKRAPGPSGRSSTDTVPPMASARRRTTASPRPAVR